MCFIVVSPCLLSLMCITAVTLSNLYQVSTFVNVFSFHVYPVKSNCLRSTNRLHEPLPDLPLSFNVSFFNIHSSQKKKIQTLSMNLNVIASLYCRIAANPTT